MNKLALLLLIGTICTGRATAENGKISLTKSNVEYYKSKANSTLKEYYGDVNLVSVNYLDAESKSQEVMHIQDEYFVDGNARIASDIPSLTQPDYSVKDYFDNVSLLSNQVDNIEISINSDATKISEIYLKNGNYIILASVEENIVSSHENAGQETTSVKKPVDVYFQITNEGKMKIYSIQSHREGVLNGLQPAPIANDNLGDVNSTSSVGNTGPSNTSVSVSSSAGSASMSGLSSLVFNVNPANSQIMVDGKPVRNDGSPVAAEIGDHTIEIISPNYYPEKFNITLESTKPLPIDMRMERLQGFLAINAMDPEVEGSEVFIDGEFAGNLPLMDYQLPVGMHNVYINGPEIFKRRFRAMINQEQVTTLSIVHFDVEWWIGTMQDFANRYPNLYVYYPPREYPVYPHGYWSMSIAEHRRFETGRMSARTEVFDRVRNKRLTLEDRNVGREATRKAYPSYVNEGGSKNNFRPTVRTRQAIGRPMTSIGGANTTVRPQIRPTVSGTVSTSGSLKPAVGTNSVVAHPTMGIRPASTAPVFTPKPHPQQPSVSANVSVSKSPQVSGNVSNGVQHPSVSQYNTVGKSNTSNSATHSNGNNNSPRSERLARREERRQARINRQQARANRQNATVNRSTSAASPKASSSASRSVKTARISGNAGVSKVSLPKAGNVTKTLSSLPKVKSVPKVNAGAGKELLKGISKIKFK